MTHEKLTELWFEGFVKAANDAGIEDAAAVAELHKVAQRLEAYRQHPEEFEAGVKEAAGLEKKAISPGLLGLLLGGSAIAGLGLHGAAKNVANTALDYGNAWRRNQYLNAYNRLQGDYSAVGGLPGMRRPTGPGMFGPGMGYYPYA